MMVDGGCSRGHWEYDPINNQVHLNGDYDHRDGDVDDGINNDGSYQLPSDIYDSDSDVFARYADMTNSIGLQATPRLLVTPPGPGCSN